MEAIRARLRRQSREMNVVMYNFIEGKPGGAVGKACSYRYAEDWTLIM